MLLSRSDIEYADSIMTAMADYLNQIGIKTQVDMVDTATMNSRRADGTYDIFMVNLATWDGNALTQNLVPRVVQDMHHNGYVNEELNALIMKAFGDMERGDPRKDPGAGGRYPLRFTGTAGADCADRGNPLRPQRPYRTD